MRNVLRQRLPYYAYDDIGELIDAVKAGTSASQRSELGLISKKAARLLFRVTNYASPRRIFQAGASTGVESVVMLGVNCESRLWLYDPRIEENLVAPRVLQTQLDRIRCYDDMALAVDEFLRENEAPKMALLNMPIDESAACRLLDAETVVVMNRLQRDKTMSELFDTCRHHLPAGQTFTNGKTAILIPNPKLQREDFVLWL